LEIIVQSFLHRFRASRIAKDVLSLSILQFVNTIIPLFTVPYFIRVLTPEGFGLTATTQSFSGYFNVVLEYGFFLTAVREVTATRNDRAALSHVFASVIWTKLVMTGLCCIIFFSLLITVPSLKPHTLEYGLAFMLTVLNTFIPGWLYQGIERLPELLTVTLVARIAQLPVMILLVRSANDVWIWLAIVAVFNGLIVATIWLKAVPSIVDVPRFPGWPTIRNQIGAGLTVFLTQGAVSLYTVGNAFLLAQFAGLKEAGFFAAVERIVRIAFGFLSPLQQALFPRSNQMAQGDRNTALQFARRSILLNAAIGAGIASCLWLGADFIQQVIFGTEYESTRSLLRVMAILPFLFACTSSLTLQISIPFRLDISLMVTYFFAAALNLTLVWILLPTLASMGMAVAVIVAEVFVITVQMFIFSRHRVNPFSRISPSP
jgi:polysaccharide transporter, PST family